MAATLALRASPQAQAAGPALTDLGVDQVTVKRGPRLLGSVRARTPEGGVTLVVSRDWLQKTHPRYYETAAQAEVANLKDHLRALRERIAAWQTERPDAKELSFFLTKQRERAERLLADADKPSAPESPFLLFVLPPEQVERVFMQPPQRRQVALLAWREELEAVETTSVVSLLRQLKARQVDPQREQFDLAERLPAGLQTDDEWCARQAIVEYQFVKPLDFQGSGDLVLRTGADGQAPAALELFTAVMQRQIGAGLGDLLEEPRPAGARPDAQTWLQSATRTAEKESLRGFRVTRVFPEASRARVETQFFARSPGGAYVSVWQHAVTVEAADINADALDPLRNDPQIKQVLELFRGLGTAGESQLDTALRIGAATRQAQQAADARFTAFRDRNLDRLDGPPLPIAAARPR